MIGIFYNKKGEIYWTLSAKMLKLSELIVLKDYGQTKGIILTYYLQYMVYFFLSMIYNFF